MELVYFNTFCNVEFLSLSLYFPLSVGGIIVVIIVEMQRLPATIVPFRVDVSSDAVQRPLVLPPVTRTVVFCTFPPQLSPIVTQTPFVDLLE